MKTAITRIQLTIALLAALVFSGTSISQVDSGQVNSKQLVTNDLKITATGQYKVNGPDPYIIFNAKQQSGSAKQLLLNLGSDARNTPIELFFNSENDLFNPHYKFEFIATTYPAALAIPEKLNLSSATRLRLDLVECSDCVINFSEVPMLVNDQVGNTLIEPNNVQTGIRQLEAESESISKSGWRLNDLSGTYTSLEISGGDPYMVSPRLNTSTHQLAGVYFKLNAPQSGEVWNDYQLFYQTERHPFTVKASSAIRIPDNENGQIEFMIPLEFLSKELPSATILQRLRLDLPEIAGQWSMIETRLIHQESAEQFESLIPAQLSHNKQQRARRLSLVKKSLLKVASDIEFLISYLLLLVLTCLFFLRTYRSNS